MDSGEDGDGGPHSATVCPGQKLLGESTGEGFQEEGEESGKMKLQEAAGWASGYPLPPGLPQEQLLCSYIISWGTAATPPNPLQLFGQMCVPDSHLANQSPAIVGTGSEGESMTFPSLKLRNMRFGNCWCLYFLPGGGVSSALGVSCLVQGEGRDSERRGGGEERRRRGRKHWWTWTGPNCFFFSFFFGHFVFLGQHPWHMDVPRLGV